MTPPYLPVASPRLWEHTLTTCQAAVTELVAYGLATPEIATRLFVEGSTVKHHLGKAMRKTQTRNRVEIARWWWEHVEHPRSP